MTGKAGNLSRMLSEAGHAVGRRHDQVEDQGVDRIFRQRWDDAVVAFRGEDRHSRFFREYRRGWPAISRHRRPAGLVLFSLYSFFPAAVCFPGMNIAIFVPIPTWLST